MNETPTEGTSELRRWVISTWMEVIELAQFMPDDATPEETSAALEKWHSFTFALRYNPEEFLNRPKSIEELRAEAASGLSLAADRMERLRLSAPDAGCELSSLIHFVFGGFADALAFFVAANRDSFSLPVALHGLHSKIECAMDKLMEDPFAAKVLEIHRNEARRRAERWRGKGKRGLDVRAPRNALVLRLLHEIENLQETWNDLVCALPGGLPPTLREPFRATLHERVREIIALPPLSPSSAAKYHRAGIAMLRDATGSRGVSNFTSHPAFRRGGEFYGLVNTAKSFTGALSEAWKNVSRHARRDTEGDKVSESVPKDRARRESRRPAT